MKYLLLLLISFLPRFVNAGDPPPLIDPPFTVKNANPMPSIISGFGPRDPESSTGTRFHEGLDLSSTPTIGDVIKSKRDGKITQIRKIFANNTLYVRYGKDEFGFHHIFTDKVGEVEIGVFIFHKWVRLIPDASRLGFRVIACDLILIKDPSLSSKTGTAGLALTDPTCPAASGELISPIDLRKWEVQRTVSAEMPMAIVGNSGTKDPHLHLFYRTADGLKNPLYRIQHENSAYTADYTATFTRDIKRSDLPKKVFVRVNFGPTKGFDLEGVDFHVETSGAAPRIIPLDDSYTFGGIPTAVADPEFIGPGTKSECNNKVKSKCRISLGMPKDDRLPEILAYPTKRPDYAKKLDFAVQLPKLEPGDYQLIVEPRSVRAAQEPLKLAFKVTAEGSVSLSSVACSSTGIAYPGIDSSCTDRRWYYESCLKRWRYVMSGTAKGPVGAIVNVFGPYPVEGDPSRHAISCGSWTRTTLLNRPACARAAGQAEFTNFSYAFTGEATPHDVDPSTIIHDFGFVYSPVSQAVLFPGGVVLDGPGYGMPPPPLAHSNSIGAVCSDSPP